MAQIEVLTAADDQSRFAIDITAKTGDLLEIYINATTLGRKWQLTAP